MIFLSYQQREVFAPLLAKNLQKLLKGFRIKIDGENFMDHRINDFHVNPEGVIYIWNKFSFTDLEGRAIFYHLVFWPTFLTDIGLHSFVLREDSLMFFLGLFSTYFQLLLQVLLYRESEAEIRMQRPVSVLPSTCPSQNTILANMVLVR